MQEMIHQTAIISEKAVIGQNVRIGAYCVIGDKVNLADNVTLHSHVVIDGNTSVGENCEVFPFAALGLAPQHTRYDGEDSQLIIGKNNVMREYVTFHPGTAVGHMKTVIGDDNLFYVGSHIAHDCIVGNHVILANHVNVGGHVDIGDYAYFGGNSAVHPFIRIGSHSIIGGGTAVTADVIPFGLASGPRAALHGLNLVGLRRRGFSAAQISAVRGAYRQLFVQDGLFADKLKQLKAEQGNDEMVSLLISFIEEGQDKNLCQPKK